MIDSTSNRDEDRDTMRSEARDPGLAGGVGETVREAGREAGDAVKRHASGLAQTLMDQAGKQVEAQRAKVADRVVGVADILQEAAQKIAEREPWLGRWVEQGAGGIHGFADTMRERDPRDLLHGVTDFARRQPALFAGAAVAIGFAFARATRGSIEGSSSGGRWREDRWRDQGWQGRGDERGGYDSTGGDYERARWQDRHWQGASPAHEHDDDRRYGFTERGLSGQGGGEGRSQGGYGQGGGQSGGMSSSEALGGGAVTGSSTSTIGGGSSGGLGAARSEHGHSGPGTSHGQVGATSGGSGSVGASGSSVPAATAAVARGQTYEQAKAAGEAGDETRLRNPDLPPPPFEPAVKAGETATPDRTGVATGATPTRDPTVSSDPTTSGGTPR